MKTKELKGYTVQIVLMTMTFFVTIRLTRTALGLSQEELSDGICSVETLSRIERGVTKVKKHIGCL